ncbi:septum formation family protein [Actinomadura kijaniata]|uniref:septum formation family protein n=1 Tax=Actinomadura kijaniata TaxID=46161 RepID=UPI001471984D|nr:septum formation family protein [Actinomadura kijaniata]
MLLALLAAVLATAAAVVALTWRDAPPKPPARPATAPAGPKVGDCLDFPSGRPIFIDARVVDCARPHEAELLATYAMPAGPYPGGARLAGLGRDECQRQFRRRFGSEQPIPGGQVVALYPMQFAWEEGDRTMRCAAATAVGATVTGSIAGRAVQARLWTELKVGDCFRTLANVGSSVRLADCGEPHDGQVTRVVPFSGSSYPGERTVRRIADAECSRHNSAVARRAGTPVKGWYTFPGQSNWEYQGERTSVCYVTGRLRTSLVGG